MKYQPKPYVAEHFDLSYFKNTYSLERCKAVALLAEMGLVKHKIRHSLAVADAAMLIAKNIEKKLGIKLDMRVVEVGALLHDVGLCTLTFEPGKNDFCPEHYYIGAEIALLAGYDEHVARCIEYHDCGGFVPETVRDLGLPKHCEKDNTLPESWEEKIVAYADTIISVEGEAFLNVWEDDHACAKGSFNYMNTIYLNRLGIEVKKNHPQFDYLDELNKEMRVFIPRDEYETYIRPEVIKMNDAQREAGIILPFSSVEEW